MSSQKQNGTVMSTATKDSNCVYIMNKLKRGYSIEILFPGIQYQRRFLDNHNAKQFNAEFQTFMKVSH